MFKSINLVSLCIWNKHKITTNIAIIFETKYLQFYQHPHVTRRKRQMKEKKVYRMIIYLLIPYFSIVLLSTWQGCASSRDELIQEAATRYPYPSRPVFKQVPDPPRQPDVQRPSEGASEDEIDDWRVEVAQQEEKYQNSLEIHRLRIASIEREQADWLERKEEIDAKRKKYINDNKEGGMTTFGVIGLVGVTTLAVFFISYLVVGTLYIEGDDSKSACAVSGGPGFRF